MKLVETVSRECTYEYDTHEPKGSHGYLLPVLLDRFLARLPETARLLEIGAGNGYVANEIAQLGFNITAIEPSPPGVELARKHYPGLNIREGSAYDDFDAEAGSFDGVYSLEVIEHLYFPRKLTENAYKLLKPGGIICLSTPFHGYWKNLVLAVTGKLDRHFTALWDHGHIKFWSHRTLTSLLRDAGFKNVEFVHVGRIYPLSKSMVAFAQKDSAGR